MSNTDSPFDPFGRGDRTIIRPNPGGRRPSPAPPAPAPAPAPAAFSALPGAASPAPSPSAAEAWSGAAPAPMLQAGAGRHKPLLLQRDVLVAPNENPFLRAGGPLLILLGRLRVALSRAPFAFLMEQVAAAIEDFERDVRMAGVTPEQTRTAKYVLCATADDIVQNIPNEDRHVWTQYSMLSRFFGERIGGVRFFDELDRAKVDPSGNYALLELQHACLALGFQGIHRTSAGGAAALQQIQRNLYEMLRRVRPKANELSPRWRGQTLTAIVARSVVPTWVIGALTAVLLFGLYLILRLLLTGDAEATADAIARVHPTTEIAIQRRFFPTPPPPPPAPPPSSQIQRVRTALAGEIAGDKVAVQETGNQIVIRVANLVLFAPGDATVKDEFKGIAARIGATLEKEPGPIRIVGHTDSAPIKTVRFPSNFHLSLERAKAVAGVLKGHVTKPERVEIDGKGPDVPVASNETAEGRAKNRRVEILIPREVRPGG